MADFVFGLEYAVTVARADQVSCMDQAKGQICHDDDDDDESTGRAQLWQSARSLHTLCIVCSFCSLLRALEFRFTWIPEGLIRGLCLLPLS